MTRKGTLTLAVLTLVVATAAGQTIVPVASVPAVKPALGATASSVTSPQNHPSERLVLTGIVGIGLYKRGFLSVERPGQPPDLYTLQENREAGGIRTIAIDLLRSRVTLQHRGQVHELTVSSGSPVASPADEEKEKDIAHARHHAERARRDRENDERLAAGGAL